MMIDPKGFSRKPSSRQAVESCLARHESVKETLRVWTRVETERAIVHGNRELICLYEEKVKKVIERVWEG